MFRLHRDAVGYNFTIMAQQITMEEMMGRIRNFVGRMVTQEAKRNYQTVAANHVKGNFDERIYQQGKATDGSGIGEKYSDNPLNVPLQDVRRIPGLSGRKTGFFSGGYEQLRKEAGRQTNFVDLELTGSLKGSGAVGTDGEDVVFGFINAADQKISKKLERQYKKTIFKVADSDLEGVEEQVNALVAKFFGEGSGE